MKSRESLQHEASSSAQLAVEIEWLAGRLPGSFLRPPPEPSPSERDIANRVEAILRDRDLVPFLGILEQHNHTPKIIPGRRLPASSSFLLGPHLFQVLESVEQRHQVHAKLPKLDQPPAEVRAHLKDVSTKSRALAKLIRGGPQPHVALAAGSDINAVLRLMSMIEASGPERQIVPFVTLLERGAAWFEALTERVPRSKQNRRPAAMAGKAHTDELRSRAAEFLPRVFRKRLGRPYHDYVATIATVISGIPTDAGFVKKVELRRTEPERRGQIAPGNH